jgi:hypothetical protein
MAPFFAHFAAPHAFMAAAEPAFKAAEKYLGQEQYAQGLPEIDQGYMEYIHQYMVPEGHYHPSQYNSECQYANGKTDHFFKPEFLIHHISF